MFKSNRVLFIMFLLCCLGHTFTDILLVKFLTLMGSIVWGVLFVTCNKED
jgi:hypothetical protein